MQPAEHRRRRHPHKAAHGAGIRIARQKPITLQNIAGLFRQLQAGLGWRDTPRRPVDQCHAQPRLEIGKRTRHGCRRFAQPGGGLPQTARIDHRNQIFEFAQPVHCFSLCNYHLP